jgi:hypothetical protein
VYVSRKLYIFILSQYIEMSSLVTEKRKGRKKGSKGKCSYCWNVMGGVLDMDHNIRTCPRRKKHAAEQEETNRKKAAASTPPRDTTPHYDEMYSNAPTPSRNLYRLRRSPRIEEEVSNAPPTQTEEEQLNALFNKKCSVRGEDRKPSAQSYGDCLICRETMYKGDIFALACGHIFHKECAPKIRKNYGDKCPKCMGKNVFKMLTRAEPPIDKMKDLEIKYQRAISRNVALNQKLKRLEKYEKDARFLWGEFVTPEIASSNFIWRNMSKRYLVK